MPGTGIRPSPSIISQDPHLFQCGYGSGIFGQMPIRIQSFDHKNLIFVAANFFKFLSNIAIYLYLGLNKGRPNYKRILHPSKDNIEHFKLEILLLRVIFSLLHQDPADQNN